MKLAGARRSSVRFRRVGKEGPIEAAKPIPFFSTIFQAVEGPAKLRQHSIWNQG